MKDARGDPQAPEDVLERHGTPFFLATTGSGQDVVHLPSIEDAGRPRCQRSRAVDRPYRRREPGELFDDTRLCRDCGGATTEGGTPGTHPLIDELEAMDPDEFPPGEA